MIDEFNLLYKNISETLYIAIKINAFFRVNERYMKQNVLYVANNHTNSLIKMLIHIHTILTEIKVNKSDIKITDTHKEDIIGIRDNLYNTFEHIIESTYIDECVKNIEFDKKYLSKVDDSKLNFYWGVYPIMNNIIEDIILIKRYLKGLDEYIAKKPKLKNESEYEFDKINEALNYINNSNDKILKSNTNNNLKNKKTTGMTLITNTTSDLTTEDYLNKLTELNEDIKNNSNPYKSIDIPTTSTDDTAEIDIKIYESTDSPIRKIIQSWASGVIDKKGINY